MNTLKSIVFKIKIILIVCIILFIESNSIAQNSSNLKMVTNSFLNDKVISSSESQNSHSISKLDTVNYSYSLNLFRKRRDLFIENKTYFFVKNESLSHQLSLDDFDLFFNKNQTEPLKKFIQNYSSTDSYSLTDFVNSSYNSMKINLANGSEVFIKKDFGAIMITDNNNFESIIDGHMYINNCSIFFIQILLK